MWSFLVGVAVLVLSGIVIQEGKRQEENPQDLPALLMGVFFMGILMGALWLASVRWPDP